jgi:hypothetical protein
MKILPVLVCIVLLMSGQQPVQEVVPQIIGYGTIDSIRSPLFAGDLSTVKVWDKYSKSHNDRYL